jgi:hypothetical protein
MTDRVSALAVRCASRLPGSPRSLQEDSADFTLELTALVSAIKETSERYAFDLEGRPDAIAAIRHALPAMEAELLDAVLDDVACELAARQEALYRVAHAAKGAPR